MNAENLAYWDIIPAIAWVEHRSIEVVNQTILDSSREDKGAAAAAQFMLNGNATPEAKEKLIEKLARGEIVAWGRRNGEGDFEEIPQVTWSDSNITFEGHGAQVGPQNFLNLTSTRWHNVRLAAKEVQKAWPPKHNDVMLNVPTIDSDKSQPTIQTKTASKVALDVWIKEATGTAQRLGQDVAWQLACKHFEKHGLKVPRDLFRKQYKALAPQHLTLQGRPRKNSPE